MSIYAYQKSIENIVKFGLSIEDPIKIQKEWIDQLEQRWAHKLPNSYKKMLSDYGSLEFDATEIYGLTSRGLDGKSIPNVVFATEFFRSRGEIANKMVRIMASGYGPYFVIDCAQMNELKEAPIYEINEHGYEAGMRKVAESFGDFLLAEVTMVIKNNGLDKKYTV